MNDKQKVWHCLLTTNSDRLIEFYNQLRLSLVPSRDEGLYVSTVAPLCIKEEDNIYEKSILAWTKQLCPRFESAFPEIKQAVFKALVPIETVNICNFNRQVKFFK